jgi:hypothetical protein
MNGWDERFFFASEFHSTTLRTPSKAHSATSSFELSNITFIQSFNPKIPK